jgi:hypothetical protein
MPTPLRFATSVGDAPVDPVAIFRHQAYGRARCSAVKTDLVSLTCSIHAEQRANAIAKIRGKFVASSRDVSLPSWTAFRRTGGSGPQVFDVLMACLPWRCYGRRPIPPGCADVHSGVRHLAMVLEPPDGKQRQGASRQRQPSDYNYIVRIIYLLQSAGAYPSGCGSAPPFLPFEKARPYATRYVPRDAWCFR